MFFSDASSMFRVARECGIDDLQNQLIAVHHWYEHVADHEIGKFSQDGGEPLASMRGLDDTMPS